MEKIGIKNNKILILYLLIFVLSLCCCGLGLSLETNKQVEAVEIISDEFVLDEYALNSEVTFPNQITVTYSSEECVAENGFVVYPDGKVVAVGKITLDQIGEYSIQYDFTCQNKRYVAVKAFNVSKKLYGLTTDNGSIIPVSAESQADGQYNGNLNDVMMTKEDGIIVRLSEGNTFEYTKSLDLTNVNSDGLCEIITLDYKFFDFVCNSDYGNKEWHKYVPISHIAKHCVIRLTDSYDVSNYVELNFSAKFPPNDDYDLLASDYAQYYCANFTAKANNNVNMGARDWAQGYTEWSGHRYFEYNGREYGVWYGSGYDYGREFNGVYALTRDHAQFTWKYDSVSGEIYVSCGDSGDRLVTVLKSRDLYGDNVFKGFSSDKVKLSIYVKDWITTEQIRLDITKIGNDDGKSLKDNYNNIGFIDNVGVPEMDFGFDFTYENGIYVPINYWYELPKPTNVIGAGKNDYSVNAYINYGTDAQIDVPVVDGKIFIDKNVQYVVEYALKGFNGGKNVYLLKIVPKTESVKPIEIKTSFDGISGLEAGKEIILPEYSVSTINKADAVKVSIFAKHEKEIVEVENGKFTPKYQGEYVIEYVCQDNVFTVVEQHVISVKSGYNLAYFDELVLPKYMIKNASYSLPDLDCYILTGEDFSLAKSTVSVSYDGGNVFQSISDYKNFKVVGDNTAIFKYSYGSDGKNVEKISEPIKIISVGYGEKNKLSQVDYFLHENFSVKTYEESKRTEVKYDSILTTGNNCLSFINAIDYTNLSFVLKTQLYSSNFKCLKIILTDYYDSEIKYEISILNKNGSCVILLNGNQETVSSYKFADDNVSKKIYYEYKSRKLTVNDMVFSNVDLREVFNSELCYVDVEMCDIYGQSSIVVDTLNGQTFRLNRRNDTAEPIISVKDFSGEYELNTVLLISVPCATDVFSPIIDSNVSIVVEKDGEYVKSLDGVLLDGSCNALREYEIMLDKYGDYDVRFIAKDGNGLSVEKTCFVSVVDVVSPEIKFADDKLNDQIKIKVGDTVDASVKVSDNYSSVDEITTSVFIRNNDTHVQYTYKSFNVRFVYSGDYTLYVYAKDAAGNYTYKTVHVIVEDK